MGCFTFLLVLFGAAVTVTQAQDAIPNLKGPGRERVRRLSSAIIATIRFPNNDLSAACARHRVDSRCRGSGQPARLGPFVILSR